MEIDERLETGNLKIHEDCIEWFEEYRNYFRNKGLIVKLDDDLMDATRYGVMMIRNAKIRVAEGRSRKVQGARTKDW